MSSWGVVTPEQEPPVRRVREEVKDGVAVICFSVLTSTTVAVALTMLTKLAG
ncbi:MAG: hypothetical protein WKF82_12310 [Nocardioidaceae bacterium]